MLEIVFLVEHDVEGGFTARALSHSIFTDADTFEALKESVRDAVRCHFDDITTRPKVIRLHWIREEVIAA